jgi:ribosome-associated protein
MAMGRRIDIAAVSPWLDVRYDCSSGPGGQNVNKVATRATLLFDFRACGLFTDVEQARLARRLSSRLTQDGRIRVVAQRERSQVANRRLAETRLLELLAEALHVAKKRRPTRPTAGSQRRRLDGKRRRGDIKRLRSSRPTTGE